MNAKVLNLKAFIVVGMLVSLISCNRGEEESRGTPQQVEVRMTDSPANYAALDVEITGVDVYIENKGWVQLSSQNQIVNVLSLTNGKSVQLGQNTFFETGVFQKVKINFGEKHGLWIYGDLTANTPIAGINLNNKTKVEMYWAGPKEIIVELDANTEAQNEIIILLDFDVAKSIIESGNSYMINPIIKHLKDANTGIEGSVSGTSVAVVKAENEKFNGTTYTDINGNFKFVGLEEGRYDLTIEYYKETDILMNRTETFKIEGVAVTKGKVSSLGRIIL